MSDFYVSNRNETLRRPRFIQWAVALLGGYFWMPCPRCGRKFGGHEHGHSSGVGSLGVCAACAPIMRREKGEDQGELSCSCGFRIERVDSPNEVRVQ